MNYYLCELDEGEFGVGSTIESAFEDLKGTSDVNLDDLSSLTFYEATPIKVEPVLTLKKVKEK